MKIKLNIDCDRCRIKAEFVAFKNTLDYSQRLVELFPDFNWSLGTEKNMCKKCTEEVFDEWIDQQGDSIQIS